MTLMVVNLRMLTQDMYKLGILASSCGHDFLKEHKRLLSFVQAKGRT
jgi:hypothetical protein